MLELRGYKYVEVPTLIDKQIIAKCLENTNNKAFSIDDIALLPEVTQYIRNLGTRILQTNKVYYIAKCFRDEPSTNANRLREFTQIGVEFLGENELDCCRDVRKDAIWLFKRIVGEENWKLVDGAERGLNIYVGEKAFEIFAEDKQVLGGGPYAGGAGWAIGLERLMNSFTLKL